MYPRQRVRGWGQVERPVPYRNENDLGAPVGRESIKQFLEGCRHRGTSDLTVSRYGKQLEALYDYLPKDKTIRYGTLEKWCESLVENGYVSGTINSYLSVANMYLDCYYSQPPKIDQKDSLKVDINTLF